MTKKWSVLRCRFRWISITYVQRWQRLVGSGQNGQWDLYRQTSNALSFLIFRLVDGILMVLDILLIPDLINLLLDVFKQVRALRQEEIKWVNEIFGSSLNVLIILIDERAFIGTRKWSRAYVSFNTINSASAIPPPLLMHELVHVWQYQQWGARYIFHALWAQRSKEGYHYGGILGLSKNRADQKDFREFNFEQQAQMVEDYFRMSESRSGRISEEHLSIYRYFIEQISKIE